MTELDLAAHLTLLAAAVTGAAAASGFAITRHALPRLAWRRSMLSVMRAARDAAAAHEAAPARRHRHNAHCPSCGRFASVVSVTPWGTVTRCTAHDLQVRRVRRIGRAEAFMPVTVTPYIDPLGEPVIDETPPLWLELPRAA